MQVHFDPFMDCNRADALAIAKDRNEFGGFHAFHAEATQEASGSFEVYWLDDIDCEGNEPGWYWRAGFPGCLPDGEPSGPFMDSREALRDADEWHPEFDEEYGA